MLGAGFAGIITATRAIWIVSTLVIREYVGSLPAGVLQGDVAFPVFAESSSLPPALPVL